jgi:hypothetical protein
LTADVMNHCRSCWLPRNAPVNFCNGCCTERFGSHHLPPLPRQIHLLRSRLLSIQPKTGSISAALSCCRSDVVAGCRGLLGAPYLLDDARQVHRDPFALD